MRWWHRLLLWLAGSPPLPRAIPLDDYVAAPPMLDVGDDEEAGESTLEDASKGGLLLIGLRAIHGAYVFERVLNAHGEPDLTETQWSRWRPLVGARVELWTRNVAAQEDRGERLRGSYVVDGAGLVRVTTGHLYVNQGEELRVRVSARGRASAWVRVVVCGIRPA